MRKVIRTVLHRLRFLLIAFLLVGIQGLAPINALVPKASAAELCQNDSAGANDVPNQKDLTKMCVDYAGVPTTVVTKWNWDELGTNGNNTMDACTLFDTDNDGNINYAVCITTTGNPATLQTFTTYSCGDAKADRCTSTAAVVSSGTTTCGVSQQSTDPFPTGGNYPNDTQGTCTVQLSTVGGASAKLVDVCSYPSAQPNSDPSDCVVAKAKSGKLEVKKDVVPDSDTGKFNLQINSVTKASDVGDNGTTGEVVVSEGNQSVGETAGTGTSLSNYTSGIVCRDLNGTGTIVAQGSGTSLSNIPVADGTDVVCLITNTRQSGTIKLIKSVTNNNGGNAGVNDFGLSIGGTSVTSGQTLALNPGNYAINEAGLTGYSFVSITGTGCPAQLGGNVNLANGQNVTCTITNDDQAGQLKVVKSVTNNNGGGASASDFTLYVNGQAKTQGQYFSANAGSYTVTESGPSGYTQTSIACVNDANQQAVAHPVNLGLGQSVTCTVSNDDQAGTLIVKKVVINDNGGTKKVEDFSFKVNGGQAVNFEVDGQNDLTVNAGTYDVTEPSVNGYATTYNNCDDVVVANGGTSTCTITNNDVAPLLTIVKNVTNDNGGLLDVSDFPLYVGGTKVTSGAQNAFSAGNYTVSENNKPGYTAGLWGGDCNENGGITLSLGGEYTCTISNNDQTAHIKVTKEVVNEHRGTAKPEDFTLKVNDTVVESGVTNDFDGNQEYTISETGGPSGYSQTDLSCTDTTGESEEVGNPFTAKLGHNYECVITNSDVSAKLKIVKQIVPLDEEEGSGQDFTFTSEELGEFKLDDDNDDTLSNHQTFLNLGAGSYTVTEQELDDWDLDFVGCQGTDDYMVLLDDAVLMINLKNGDDVTCTFINEEMGGQPPVESKGSISGHKFNDVNGNGIWDQDEPTLAGWTITATECDGEGSCNGNTSSMVTDQNGAFLFADLDSGEFRVCEVQKSGWTQTLPGGGGCWIVEVSRGKECVVDFGNKAKPQVLVTSVTNEVKPAVKALVNTGSAAGKQIAFGLVILSILGVVHLLSVRRREYAK